MCLAYLYLGDPRWPLLLAANRDESHARDSTPLGPWPGHPGVYAGRDLVAGGTWLGCDTRGRYALLTNYREPGRPVAPDAPSRGVLVRDYLLGDQAASQYLDGLRGQASAWAGFNLIAGDVGQSWYLGNRAASCAPQALAPGAHTLSNHLLDTPWPKTERIRRRLADLPAPAWVEQPELVFEIMRDTTRAPDAELPDTGLAIETERLLSSPFIESPGYGTRCTSILAFGARGDVFFSELGYDAAGRPGQRHDWRLQYHGRTIAQA